jgi:hypothetical protein
MSQLDHLELLRKTQATIDFCHQLQMWLMYPNRAKEHEYTLQEIVAFTSSECYSLARYLDENPPSVTQEQ